jgi:hypothetical protein
MAKREKHLERSSDDSGTFFQEVLPRIRNARFVERGMDLVQERPGTALAIALGTGVVLGATIFSRVGRFVFISALGVGAEIAMRRMKSSFFDGFAGDARPA